MTVQILFPYPALHKAIYITLSLKYLAIGGKSKISNGLYKSVQQEAGVMQDIAVAQIGLIVTLSNLNN